MGQRLNLEIYYKDKPIANAYYHWSGYTSSSLSLTDRVLGFLDNNSFEDYDDKVEYAVAALESTGARLTEKEAEEAEAFYDVNSEYQIAVDRNDGLIAVSKNGMQTTRDWAETEVRIYIDTQEIELDNIIGIDKDCWKREENIADTDWEAFKEQIPTYEGRVFGRISYDDFCDFAMFYFKNEPYTFMVTDEPNMVYIGIE